MKLGILFHDNCFDGLASAALFLAYARERIDSGLHAVFGGLMHGRAGEVSEGPLDTGPLGPWRLVGDMNVIVDFRYMTDERLDWWFDHHKSAFETEDDRRHFERDRSGRKYFDPKAPSCSGLISRMLARDHGFDPAPYSELIHWAEIIDSAKFPDPTTAVELREPALRLMTWIENSRLFSERAEVIERMLRQPLAEIVAAPFVQSGLGPVLERHEKHLEAMRACHRLEGDVVWCDLTSDQIDAVNKFIPYYLQPSARYAVVVTRSSTRAKVSVGYSPWADSALRRHDISQICERFGGGGHPVVGAVSLPVDETERAVAIGWEIAQELSFG